MIRIKFDRHLLLGLSFSLGASLAWGQDSSSLLEAQFPQLAQYLNTSEILQATVFDEITAANASPESMIGKGLLRESLKQLVEAEYSHYHTSGDHLAMLGPHRLFESRATPGLQALVRDEFAVDEIEEILSASGDIPPRAIAVLKRGREFSQQLVQIYVNDGVMDKYAAVDNALANYLSNDELSVAVHPKSSELLSEHPYAYAFRVGFPQLSGITWASQWLQLATLEISLIASNQAALEAGLDNATELYVEKIARAHGSMISLPTDIPTMPVIAPNFYGLHPGASYVIDNISALKVVIGDILAHPDVPDREAAINDAIEGFTDKENFLDDEMDYLYFVLRGGIFNQGGPALGGMESSERNRSRLATETKHVSNYPMR
ncbi:MAG: hypothetical protein R3332_07665 [Pseudohongiellaceae bacterium]|nr:hypothetical protein [Pseudohongiellaceae bacterium]